MDRLNLRLNINEHVEVQLNDIGREILQKERRELQKQFPSLEAYVPNEDEEGWSKWQLHSLMHTFGPYMQIGLEPPFNADIRVIIK